MRARIRFNKPYPHGPFGQTLHDFEADLVDGVAWVECKVSEQTPMGRFGVDVASRAVITPLAEVQKRGPGRPPKAAEPSA